MRKLSGVVIANFVRFEYNEDIGRFILRLQNKDIDYITLSDQLNYILGYEEGEQIRDGSIAKYACDLRGGVSHICCYINGGVIDEMIVGDTMTSLLQIVAISGKSGDIIDKKYDSPMLSRVISKELNEIQIELRTLEGRLVPFEYGTVIVTLIFKKVIVF